MMNVLLANVAMWRGNAEEGVKRGREALLLFRGINDAWGEVQAAAPTARALASLGRFKEFLQLLSELNAAAQRVADPSFARIGPTIAGAVATQAGEAERALQKLVVDDDDAKNTGRAGNVDRALAYGGALMQNDRVDEALTWLEPAYALADEDGPRAALGGLLTIVYAAAGRAADAVSVADATAEVQGGTYSDRMWRRWGEGYARLQLGDTEGGLAALDDADATTAATDSKVDQAVTALARAIALEAIGHVDAVAARVDAMERFAELGVTGYGWERVFTTAGRHIPAPGSPSNGLAGL
jgi:hypothetical protein